MIKDSIRHLLNKQGFEIIKQPYVGDVYPNLSKNKEEYYCETPIGNYFLPIQYKKDPVANDLIRGREFEPDILNVARKYIKKNTTVIDAGANFGHMTVAYSKLVGDGGSVYAIEAQKSVQDLLRKTIAANQCSNVHLIAKASYNVTGKILYFQESIVQASGASVTESNTKGEAVETITIDSLNIQTPISFMKIDVEGSDLFTLQGARETILRNKMPIVFEFLQHVQEDFGTSFNDYVEFVHSINYEFKEVVGFINYVIVPKG
ncbi:MAG TPA: FkbM family methyltransferase [Ferruginibacter sp.]|nr:FkbM family methyltransferase [Ferruginibacter sp.]